MKALQYLKQITPLFIMRQYNLSAFLVLLCSCFGMYLTMSHMELGGNKFFIIVGGVTLVTLGFAFVLHSMNYFAMPPDRFYSDWSWMNYILAGVVLLTTLTIPEESLINYLIIFSIAILNLCLFMSSMQFRSTHSTEINKMRKLFPDEKQFKFDFDFVFARDFKGVVNKKKVNFGLCLLTNSGKIVLAGDHFYFDDKPYSAEKLAKDLEECELSFNKASKDDLKVVEMATY